MIYAGPRFVAGNNLTKIRGKHQITLTELAEKVGITKQALSLNEKNKLSLKVALKVENILGENVFDLLGSDALVMLPRNEEEKAILIKMIKEL